MDMDALLLAARTVLTDQRVIVTAIAVLLVMNFGSFVANYVKKEPPKKAKHTEKPKATPKPAPAPAPDADAEESEKAGDSE